MLAYRLGSLFTQIKTEEDRVRHNDVLAEVLDLINSESPKEGKLTRPESELLSYIAEKVMILSEGKKAHE